jgi:septal ring factor EnvC (AmiA/AmiB activator)
LVKDGDAANRDLAAQIAALQEWQERKYTFAMTQGHLMPPVLGRVEVGFGEVRHPRFGTVTMHRGLDYRAGLGAPVRSVFWGRVAFIGWLTGYGTTLIVDHGRGWHTVYAHLDSVQVAVGDLVPARARIGKVGQSGSIKGRYLYFEIRRNGQPVDPSDWFHRR